MNTVNDLPTLREIVRIARASGNSIGLVPTMGALHEGHLSLVRRARQDCGFVVVSIFVNPLQFAPGEDFSRYPRQPEEDEKVLVAEGADLLYRPDEESFYTSDFSTAVDVAGVSEGGEGSVRPGHFRGVATVVAKLFLQVAPDAAFFGRKDLQQAALVRRMAHDLDFPLRIVIGDTVREPDGLALSSRNVYLSAEDRQRAALFPKILFAASERAGAKETDARPLEGQIREELVRGGFTVDYVEIVDPDTMRRKETARQGDAIAAAIRLGKTRLIDNVLIRGKR
jgi:pantoate--beta-alanine ligase